MALTAPLRPRAGLDAHVALRDRAPCHPRRRRKARPASRPSPLADGDGATVEDRVDAALLSWQLVDGARPARRRPPPRDHRAVLQRQDEPGGLDAVRDPRGHGAQPRVLRAADAARATSRTWDGTRERARLRPVAAARSPSTRWARSSPASALGLLAHLDGCAACREPAHELAQTASALAFVDRDDVGPTASVPPALTERVLGALHDDALAATATPASRRRGGRGRRRDRRVRRAPPRARRVGPDARHAAAILSGRARSATATVGDVAAGRGARRSPSPSAGCPPGGVYVVSMRTVGGSWWAAGSVPHGRGAPLVGASMSCYVPLRQDHRPPRHRRAGRLGPRPARASW